jgi:hypothetical protein
LYDYRKELNKIFTVFLGIINATAESSQLNFGTQCLTLASLLTAAERFAGMNIALGQDSL